MRAYAMVLGLVLTAGYGYAAQLALTSVSTRPTEPAATIGEPSTPGRLWYGGMLDPVTVEAKGESPGKTAIARRWLLDHSGARCPQPSHRYSALL